MADNHELRFSADQAIRAQRALREALGLGAEQFPLRAFIGMISDEIEQMRASGRPDADVVEIIRQQTGKSISPADLQRFYAPAQERLPE